MREGGVLSDQAMILPQNNIVFFLQKKIYVKLMSRMYS